LRRVSAIVLPVVLGCGILAADLAAAQTCFTLEAELRHLESRGGGGGSRDRNRYERAWREQANVLARTEMRAREAGCFGGFFLFQAEPQPICERLVPKLQEMQDNLARLDQMRRQGGGNRYAGRIQDIRAMMAERGCGYGDGQFFSWFEEEDEDDVWRYGDAREPEPYRETYQTYGGTFRTLCVRTCDGYYFPISFSTTQDQFVNDAQTCSAMCPGAEAQLYYYENPGGGPENMTAITGEPYSSLPTAFQYRTSYNPSCTCKPAGGYSVAAALSSDTAVEEKQSAALPRPRPAPGEDPETLANRLGSFVPRAVSDDGTVTALSSSNGDGRPIRVVGPPIGTAEQDALIIAPVPN
jgi:hypothetical protein